MARTTRRPKRANGEGSIWKSEKDQCWYAEVALDDGRRPRRKARTQAEAVAKLKQLLIAPPVHDSGLSVADWLDHWLGEILPSSATERTVRGYREVAEAYIVPHVGRVKLAQLGPEHVDRMMNALSDAGYSGNTRRLARSILRRSLTVAAKRGLVSRNAAALTDAPKGIRPKLDDALDAKAAHKVLAAAEGDPLEALAVLVLTMGLRQGEARTLRWRDLDLGHAKLTVTAAKTDAGVRTIPLPASVVAALRRHKIASKYKTPDDYVFASATGTMRDGRNLLRWWHGLTERAGVGRRRFHASRHTAATLMLNNGVPLEVVSAILGHAGLAITADVYAKVGSDLQRQAADVMEEVLGAGASGA
jgi:integrase